MREPELLAPAGDWECLQAAVENGADAVYFGLLDGFNARARAANLDRARLPQIFAYLHRRAVKGYVTLNTLVFPSELSQLEALIVEIACAGADGLIVQDVGVARLARALCPTLPLHASTQMSLSSAGGLKAAEELGISRVILARELSLAQIAALGPRLGVELEVFVHGALCMSFSGQCLASLMLGGRSGNRGCCAQPCRQQYDLLCDGSPQDLSGRRYLLSPLDLAAFRQIPALVSSGVTALKIEGRLKGPDYVSIVTRFYREAIDAAIAGKTWDPAESQIEALALAFSRGLSPGWLTGRDHRALVPATHCNHRGIRLGEIRGVLRGRLRIALAATVRRGDGVLIPGRSAEEPDQGGRVYEVFQAGRSLRDPIGAGEVELTFAHDAIDWQRITPGLTVWKTDDPRVGEARQRKGPGDQGYGRVPIDLKIEAMVGHPLHIQAAAANGSRCALSSTQSLEKARRHPLTIDVLRQQFGRLGGSLYQLRSLDARIGQEPMVPLSVLGELRKKLIAELDAAAPRTTAHKVLPGALALLQAAGPATARVTQSNALLHVLCRNPTQIAAAARGGASSAIVEWSDAASLRRATDAAQECGISLYVATPRMELPDEESLLDPLEREFDQGVTGVVARTMSALRRFAGRGKPIVADFSLNAVNGLTCREFQSRGADRITLAPDLPVDEMAWLASAVGDIQLEILLFWHPPLFHTQFCLWCGLLEAGHDRADCGRACRRHELKLRDRRGVEHTVGSDLACRNTVFHGEPKTLDRELNRLRSAAIAHYRLEMLPAHSAQAAQRLVERYRRLLGLAGQ